MALALIVAELAFRAVAPTWVPLDFRLPDKTTSGLEELVATAQSAPGVRVAVIGDSIVWGKFADNDQTISAAMNADYRRAGRKVRAFNFGMIGAQAYDIRPLTEVLARRNAADLVLIDLDYHFYKPAPRVDRYPQLESMVAELGASSGEDPVGLGAVETTGTAASRAQHFLAGVSLIFARREYVQAATLGGPPSLALSHAARVHLPRLLGIPPWGKRTSARLSLERVRTAYAVPLLNREDSNLSELAAAVRAARSNGIEVAVFTGPLDMAPIEAAGGWDPTVYRANLDLVRSMVEGEGGRFLDLTDAVPGSQMYDMHHPLSDGYGRLARVLEEAIDPTVRGLEQDRAGVR